MHYKTQQYEYLFLISTFVKKDKYNETDVSSG